MIRFRMHKAVAASMMLVSVAAQAITPLWLRDVKISPDAKQIAFTYRGDIYTVPTAGGEATRLTSHPGYEANPVWSPDGSMIAFASDRHGNFDVFVIPAAGGRPTRLTRNSASEIPEAFTPDGEAVVFSAAIQDPASSALFPTSRMSELYRVNLDGSAPKQILATPARAISYSPDGSWFAYQDVKGFEDEWRKHHTSSVTRDIWRYDLSTGKHTNLVSRPGEDLNPVVGVDGSTLYFLSERDGDKSIQVYAMDAVPGAQARRLTDFATHPVRFLSQGADGTLAFTYDGEIYTMAPNQQPKKVEIDIVQDWDSPVTKHTVKSGAKSAAVSPDGKEIALTSRGEVFVTSVEYPTTRTITSTPQRESSVEWGSDPRSIVYTSDRSGVNNIYTASIARKDDPNFANATAIEEKALFDDDNIERSQPHYSPDGKKLAFVQDRNCLMVKDMQSGAVKQLTGPEVNPQRGQDIIYSWSPDSKWIVMEAILSGREPYTDILLVNAETGERIPITETGYFDESPSWALDGQAILFKSERYGMRNHASWGSMYDAMIVFLNQDAFDSFNLSPEDYELKKEVDKANKKSTTTASETKTKGKAKKGKPKAKADTADQSKEESKVKATVVEKDGLQQRIKRLTPHSTSMGDLIITPDGEKLYYVISTDNGGELWSKQLRKGDHSKVTSLDSPSVGLYVDKDGKNLYLLGSSMMKQMDLKSEKLKNISYAGTMTLNPEAEREYMFRDAALQERERFYDTGMHGVDWPAMTEAYAKFLPHISNNYDFAELLSEWLGELNVSHTGGRYRASHANADQTASLGLLYDLEYDGPGLKVAEVVTGGPLDNHNSKVKPGVIIEAIGDSIISGAYDPAAALLDIKGRKTLLRLYDPAGGKRWDEVVIPISTGAMNSLLYKRWVKARAEDVDKWSNGRLGYVHIASMDDESYRKVYADLLGKYAQREGVVVDIRWNGGGRLHEDIEVLLTGDKYLTQVIRGRESCDMPSRRWNKPSVMLMAEPCYSNAHGTPWVYKNRKIGKLVGMPVPGTMTSVNWVTMQDPSLVYGIPVIGYRTAEGTYLENSQLEPDVKVANDPSLIVKGEDTQLRTAVETLLKQLDSK